VVDELDLMAVFRLKAQLTVFLSTHTQEIAETRGKCTLIKELLLYCK